MSCALCSAGAPLFHFDVSGGPEGAGVEICATCKDQIEGDLEPNHWRCLSSSMWSEDPAVQVLAARVLKRLEDQDWARDLAEQLWLEDETHAWALPRVSRCGTTCLK